MGDEVLAPQWLTQKGPLSPIASGSGLGLAAASSESRRSPYSDWGDGGGGGARRSDGSRSLDRASWKAGAGSGAAAARDPLRPQAKQSFEERYAALSSPFEGRGREAFGRGGGRGGGVGGLPDAPPLLSPRRSGSGFERPRLSDAGGSGKATSSFDRAEFPALSPAQRSSSGPLGGNAPYHPHSSVLTNRPSGNWTSRLADAPPVAPRDPMPISPAAAKPLPPPEASPVAPAGGGGGGGGNGIASMADALQHGRALSGGAPVASNERLRREQLLVRRSKQLLPVVAAGVKPKSAGGTVGVAPAPGAAAPNPPVLKHMQPLQKLEPRAARLRRPDDSPGSGLLRLGSVDKAAASGAGGVAAAAAPAAQAVVAAGVAGDARVPAAGGGGGGAAGPSSERSSFFASLRRKPGATSDAAAATQAAEAGLKAASIDRPSTPPAACSGQSVSPAAQGGTPSAAGAPLRSVPSLSPEAEAAFLASLGWTEGLGGGEEDDEEAGLTEEEIRAFQEASQARQAAAAATAATVSAAPPGWAPRRHTGAATRGGATRDPANNSELSTSDSDAA